MRTSDTNNIPEDGLEYRKSSMDFEARDKIKNHVEKMVSINKAFQIKTNLNENPMTTALRESHISKYPLSVTPDEIIFKDIKPGQIYQMFLQVKNLTKRAKRVRVFQPKTSNFRCDYDMMGSIAPGLSIELIVSFETPTAGEFRDMLKIISDDDIEIDVPIYAFTPTAKIIFEPFIHMGFIEVGKPKTSYIKFRNEGSMEGRVE